MASKVSSTLIVALFLAIAAATSSGKSHLRDKSFDSRSLSQARQLLQQIGLKSKDVGLREKVMPYALRYIRDKNSESLPMTDLQRYRTTSNGDVTFTCSECQLGVGLVMTAIELGEPTEDIVDSLIDLCITLDITTADVCTDMINLMQDTVLYIAEHTTLNTDEICGIYIGGDCMTQEIADKIRWTVELPSTPKPPVVPVDVPAADSPTLRFLQITDIHYDKEYIIGSLAECAVPCCCEGIGGNVTSPDQAAGMWGDYRSCDIPEWTLEDTIIHINQSVQVDYIIWTGDIPAHDVWKQTKESVLSAIDELYTLFQMYFPNTPIFPALGNHEANPIDCFSQPEVNTTAELSMDWLLGPVADYWMKFLPADTYDTIRYGGYYTTLIRPGFRMIAVNTNYGHNTNWWNLLDIPDPAGQLAWLAEQLDAAEQNGEKVHLLAHIPAIPSLMLSSWLENYQRILTRYESTIMAQFHGHVHVDEFTVYRDANDTSRAVGVGYAAPSLTTYSDLNPAYRIYTVDGDRENSTRAILDHSTYYIDMSVANLSPDAPQWNLVYSAKEAYNMNSLNPSEWFELAQNMQTNDTLLQLYYSYYHRFSAAYSACDDDCQTTLLDFILAPLPL